MYLYMYIPRCVGSTLYTYIPCRIGCILCMNISCYIIACILLLIEATNWLIEPGTRFARARYNDYHILKTRILGILSPVGPSPHKSSSAKRDAYLPPTPGALPRRCRSLRSQGLFHMHPSSCTMQPEGTDAIAFCRPSYNGLCKGTNVKASVGAVANVQA
jgi:hypothetical protein